MDEKATAHADQAGHGQWWVKSDTPNIPMFTNDAGTDYEIITDADTQTLTNKTINGSNNTISNVDLTSDITGTLPVGNGGTGATTLTDGGVLLGSGTGAVTAMAVLADGEMIVGDGTTDPVAESGATLRTSIGVGTGDSPQFTGIELGHASDTTLARVSAGVMSVEGSNVLTAATGVEQGQFTIWVPAAAMVASTTNGCALTQVEYGTNDVDILVGEFDSATEEYAQFQIQMPKSWDESTIIAQFVWSTAATSGDVIWALQGTAIADDDAIDSAWGTAQTVTDTAKGTASDIAITSETSAITISGSPAAEEYVQFRVYRDADAVPSTRS
jgi:hypothetical protein